LDLLEHHLEETFVESKPWENILIRPAAHLVEILESLVLWDCLPNMPIHGAANESQ
jgi:hypothetical protein